MSGFIVLQALRPKIAGALWVGAFLLYAAVAVVVTAVSSEEQIRATIEKFATDDTVASAQCLVLSSSAAAIYSQPIALPAIDF